MLLPEFQGLRACKPEIPNAYGIITTTQINWEAQLHYVVA